MGHGPGSCDLQGVQYRSDVLYNRYALTSTLLPMSLSIKGVAEQFDVRYEQGVYVYGEVPYVYKDKARTVQSISKYIK